MAEEYKITQIDLSEVNYKYLLKDILGRWLLILCAAAIFAMAGFVYGNEKAKGDYSSSMTLVVTVRGSVNNAYQNMKSALSLSGVMNQVLNSGAMKRLVSKDLGLDYLPGDITSSTVEGTNFVRMTATASDPKTAFRMVNSAFDNLKEVSGIIATNAFFEVFEDASLQSYSISVRAAAKQGVIFGLIGFALAVALSILGTLLDKSIRNRKQLDRKINARAIAAIPEENKRTTRRISGKKPSMLITDLARSVRYVEAVKSLRIAIEREQAKNGSQVFAVTSSFENEGKTTVSANLAVALSKKGYRVLLIDTDLRKPAIYKVFELSVAPEAEIGLFLESKDNSLCKLYKDKVTGVTLLLGTKSFKDAGSVLASRKMKTLIENARKKYDYIVIDTSPLGLVPDTEEILNLADASLIVIRENRAPYLAVNDIIRHMNEFNARLIGCVYNRETASEASAFSMRESRQDKSSAYAK